MANKRNAKKGDTSRDGGGFVAMPWQVTDCPAYSALSHPAKALLMEFARQVVRDNNGRLLASSAYLKPRGWRSVDVITRAKRELIEAGFIHETVKGCRPNKAGWYAVTWRTLDRIPGYDAGAAETFERGAYRKNAPLRPSHGVGGASIAPSHGVGGSSTAPSPGAIRPIFTPSPTPPHGDHLDMPSPGVAEPAPTDGDSACPEVVTTLAELWARVGCRSNWLTVKPAVVPARVEVGRRAQQVAIEKTRVRPRPAPPPAPAPDHITRVRGGYECHDLSAWGFE